MNRRYRELVTFLAVLGSMAVLLYLLIDAGKRRDHPRPRPAVTITTPTVTVQPTRTERT